MKPRYMKSGNRRSFYGKKKFLPAMLIMVVLITLLPAAAFASPVYPGIVDAKDSNGNTLKVRNYGDESFSYMADLDGSLMYRGSDGLCYYIVKDGDGLALAEQMSDDSQSLQHINIKDMNNDFRQELEAFYAQMQSGSAALFGFDESNDSRASALQGYVAKEGVDPLYGKWVASGQGFTEPGTPQRGDVCPLLVIKVQYEDIKCVFSDQAWSQRIFGSKSVSSYYNEVSDNKFTYVPAKESSGDKNDGVITVTLPIERPVYQSFGAGNNYDRGAKAGLYSSGDGKQKYAVYGEPSIFAYGVEAAEEYIDFAQYDQRNDDYFNGNNDGYISSTELAVVVVNSGYEAGLGLCVTGDTATWAGSWYANNWWKPEESSDDIVGSTGGILADGVQLYKYTAVGELLNGPVGRGYREYDYSKEPSDTNVPYQAEIGTLCHELAHDLGLHDLYRTDGVIPEREVGSLSLMAYGNWGVTEEDYYSDMHGSTPSHLDAYSKILLGFYDAETISDNGRYTVTQASDSENYNILRINTDDPDVYYLVENRTFTGFDAGMYASFNPPGGVVYWRIDEAVIREKGDANQINNEDGRYGVMPEYMHFEYTPLDYLLELCKPFRNRQAISLFPEQRRFNIPEKSNVFLTSDDDTAAVMNVWLNSLALLTPAAAGYDKYTATEGLSFTLDSGGYTLFAVKNGSKELTAGMDYTVKDNVYTITQEYLNGQKTGLLTLSFDMNDGTDPAVSITVSDSAPGTAKDSGKSGGSLTGDGFTLYLWIMLATLSGFAAALAVYRRKSEKHGLKKSQ